MGMRRHAGVRAFAQARQLVENRMIILQRDAPLLLVVHTLHPSSRLARSFHRRKKKADQNPDNRNRDQQLDQRKTANRTRAQTAQPPRFYVLFYFRHSLFSVFISQVR